MAIFLASALAITVLTIKYFTLTLPSPLDSSSKGPAVRGNGGGSPNPHSAVLDALDAISDRRRDQRNWAVSVLKEIDREADPNFKTSYDMFEPEANCISDERFGSEVRYAAFGDGPKFVCGVDLIASIGRKNQGCLVYSVGSSDMFDFEIAVKKHLGCETHTFDPTVTNFHGGEYATFHKWGLGVDGHSSNKRSIDFEEKSLSTIYEALGHQGRRINILKIDCEGCEWEAMKDIFSLISS